MNSSSADNTSLSLLQRARGDDQAAWQTMVTVYGPIIEKWCLRAGVSRNDLNDLTQEVFRRVVSNLKDFRRDQTGQSFRGWLRTISLNLVRNHFRNLSGKPRAQGGSEHLLSLEQVSECVEGESEQDVRQERGEILDRALRIIKNDFEVDTWSVFWRTVIDGEPTESVATSTGKNSKAIRQARTRVLKRLREEFADLIDFDSAENA